MFYLKDQSILRRGCTFFDTCWQEEVMAKNVIRVPQGCPTINEAMELAEIFSWRSVYSKERPLKIDLDEGVHKIDTFVPDRLNTGAALRVTCHNITFAGKGRYKTIIDGGFQVLNRKNITFEAMAIHYNPDEDVDNIDNPDAVLALYGSLTNANVLNCEVKGGRNSDGMVVGKGATVTATNCSFLESNHTGVTCRGANTKVTLNKCNMERNGLNGVDIYGCAAFRATICNFTENMGCGVYTWNAKAILFDCLSHRNDCDGLFISDSGTVTATNSHFVENAENGVCCRGDNTDVQLNDCTSHHNKRTGLFAWNRGAVARLRGTKTDIHSNKKDGIQAGDGGHVMIYLPSEHNTSHDNEEEDMRTCYGTASRITFVIQKF